MDSSHFDANVITTQTDNTGAQVISVVHTNVTESSRVTANLVTGGVGPQGDTGPQGAQGIQGETGETGPGVPNGGTTAQVLRKASNANQDTEWHTLLKGDLGLGNVDNTSDANKPVSTAQAAADAAIQADIDAHEARTDNPHAVTKTQVGLSNVDNTSDANKPVSTAQQTALDGKQNSDADLTSIAGLDSSTSGAIASDGAGWIKKTYAQFKTALGLVKGDVGLGNVDNTSDANKPISTATQTALDAKQDLDSDLTAIAALTPSNDDVIQRKGGAWVNRTMAQIKTDLALTKSDVGLSNVDNTSDANKPVSTAQQTALDLKANDADVVHDTGDETVAGVKTFSSSPLVPVPTTDAQAANKEYVDDAITAGGGYTDEQAQDAVGAMIADTATIDLTYTDATPELKADVKDDSITYAKMQNVSATDKLLGRSTAGAGDVEEIPLTAAGRALLDDATVDAMIDTLGGAAATGSGALVRKTSPVLTTPTIADFTNAAHDHGDADDGGQLVWQALPDGALVQEVAATASAVATGNTTIPADDTIPQNTEGTQFITLGITPKATSHRLVIEITATMAVDTASRHIIGAFFQDTTANALAAGDAFVTTANGLVTFVLRHEMAAGTTSPTTFKFRAGPNNTAIVTFNGQAGGRIFGAIPKAVMTIREIKA